MVGNVIPTPHGWQACIGQSSWALSTAIGVARLLPGLLALVRSSTLGPFGPWALGGPQEAGWLWGAGHLWQRLCL